MNTIVPYHSLVKSKNEFVNVPKDVLSEKLDFKHKKLLIALFCFQEFGSVSINSLLRRWYERPLNDHKLPKTLSENLRFLEQHNYITLVKDGTRYVRIQLNLDRFDGKSVPISKEITMDMRLSLSALAMAVYLSNVKSTFVSYHDKIAEIFSLSSQTVSKHMKELYDYKMVQSLKCKTTHKVPNYHLVVPLFCARYRLPDWKVVIKSFILKAVSYRRSFLHLKNFILKNKILTKDLQFYKFKFKSFLERLNMMISFNPYNLPEDDVEMIIRGLHMKLHMAAHPTTLKFLQMWVRSCLKQNSPFIQKCSSVAEMIKTMANFIMKAEDSLCLSDLIADYNVLIPAIKELAKIDIKVSLVQFQERLKAISKSKSYVFKDIEEFQEFVKNVYKKYHDSGNIDLE